MIRITLVRKISSKRSTMQGLSFFTILVACGAVASLRPDRPDFCNDYDCPEYTEIQVGPATWSRQYPATTWVATSLTRPRGYAGTGWRDASTMFRKLFKYITGNNDEDAQIAMTVPVLTRYHVAGGAVTVTMLFYLPPAARRPAPRDDDVFLTTLPAGNMLVRTFDTYMMTTNAAYNSNLEQLKVTATSQGLTFEPNTWYHVGYDSPWTFFRHNEVWLQASE